MTTRSLELDAERSPPIPLQYAQPKLLDVGDESRAGFAFAMAAYLSWGFIPVYYKLLTHVPPLLVLCHRIIWSVVLLALVVTVQRKWDETLAAVRSRRTMLALLCSTTLIGLNWYVFIWAISNKLLPQASLGYFINPLVNVLLGVVVLRERLRFGQIIGLLLATAGVAVMTATAGGVPWVALTLAFTFGLYGLIRKVAPVGPLAGLSVETAILFPASLMLVTGMLTVPDVTTSLDYSATTYALLVAAGVITAMPLLWFSAAARRLRLSTLGFIQYVAPTCQFLLAVVVYREPFNSNQLLSFAFIWAGLAAYTAETVLNARRERAAAASAEPICVPE